MFEINEDFNIETESIQKSIVYTIDNFYKYPDKVLDLFTTIDPPIHLEHLQPSFNQIYFDDRRHIFRSKKIVEVYKFLGKLCNQKAFPVEDIIFTNFTRFEKVKFNDYHNNYWWPHRDKGYTGILYLNEGDNECGTNLYENLGSSDYLRHDSEHFKPWRNKNNHRLIKSIQPKYNRMVLFDGLKFYHGMNICNERYFSKEYRMNQVFFFEQAT